MYHLWFIQKHICDWVFEHTLLDSIKITLDITSCQERFCILLITIILKTPKSLSLITQDNAFSFWILQPTHCIVINCNGVWNAGSKQGNMGIVGRCQNKNVVFGAHSIVVSNSTLKTECLAFLYALNLVKSSSCTNFQLKNDSKILVDYLTSDVSIIL